MRHLVLLLFLFSSSVFAADSTVSLQFRSINVVQLLHVVYTSVLKKDFVISDSVLQLQQSVSMNVGRIEVSEVLGLMKRVLAGVGVESKEVGGLTYFDVIAKSVPNDQVSSMPQGGASGLLQPAGSSSNVASLAAVPSGASASSPDAALDDSDLAFDVYRPRFRTAEYLSRVSGIGPRASSGPGDGFSSDVVVVRGQPKKREATLALLAALDVQAPVVDVRAVVVEVALTDDTSFDVGVLLSMLGGRLSISLNALAVPLNVARLQVGGLNALLGAMAGDSRFKFRSQPSLRLTDGSSGKLQVGTDTPVRGQISTNKDGTVLQSIEYRSSGLVLNVLPRVLADRVQAQITQEISSFARTVTSGIDSPTLNKRSISANVDVESGEVVVLAGLEEETQTVTKSGLPFFRGLSSNSSSGTTHLVVLLEFTRIAEGPRSAAPLPSTQM